MEELLFRELHSRTVRQSLTFLYTCAVVFARMSGNWARPGVAVGSLVSVAKQVFEIEFGESVVPCSCAIHCTSVQLAHPSPS